MSELYTIFSIIYYDNVNEIYKPVVCINKIPNGNLKNYIQKITNSKLSKFKINESDYCNNICLFAIKSFNNCNEFLHPNDISELYEFIINNNYSIDHSFTSLIDNKKNYNSNNKKLIIYIKYG